MPESSYFWAVLGFIVISATFSRNFSGFWAEVWGAVLKDLGITAPQGLPTILSINETLIPESVPTEKRYLVLDYENPRLKEKGITNKQIYDDAFIKPSGKYGINYNFVKLAKKYDLYEYFYDKYIKKWYCKL